MEELRLVSRWIHIVLGTIGLLAFWFPVFSRKGGPLHRKAGKVFVLCGYGVVYSAWLSCLLIIYKAWGLDSPNGRTAMASAVFLFYLGLVTFVGLRHSMAVLKAKKDPTLARTRSAWALAWLSIVSSPAVFVFAIAFKTSLTPVLFALSPIGVLNGRDVLNFFKNSQEPRAWFYEHLKATLGVGIAFHTAFMVFGSQRFLDLPVTGWIGILPWLLPALIGVPATLLWERHYRQRFGDLPGAGTQPELRLN